MKGHPLEVFRFCPKCGSSDFKIHNALSRHCANCGFTYYQNPRASTAAFILNGKGELLVARRAKEPAKGTLDLPGGFVDMYETVEDGMRREIKEETGLEVTDIQYLYSSPNVYEYSGMGIHTLDMDFLVRVHGDVPPIKAADDAAEALWISIKHVNPAEFGLTSIRNAVIRFIKEGCFE